MKHSRVHHHHRNLGVSNHFVTVVSGLLIAGPEQSWNMKHLLMETLRQRPT